MATHRIPIFGFGALPDASGNVFFEPYKITDTAAILDPLVLVFADLGTLNGIRGSFRVPENYVGSADLEMVWTANATSGTLRLEWTILTRSGVEDMGAAATRTTEGQTDTKGGTVFLREQMTIALTDADYVAGDEALFELLRDVATDTMAAKALVFSANFKYTDA